ncbi:hypothetical protein LG299_12530 [Microbacterium lacus]|uniref:hypothetical protein n=1 Tax=Microbacterium lacus TaxID=415217 RepID=UPI00384B3A2E
MKNFSDSQAAQDRFEGLYESLAGEVQSAIRRARRTLNRWEVEDLAQDAWAEVLRRLRLPEKHGSAIPTGRERERAAVCRVAFQVACEATGIAVSRRALGLIAKAERALGARTGEWGAWVPPASAVIEWLEAAGEDSISEETVVLARLARVDMEHALGVTDRPGDVFEELCEEGSLIFARVEAGDPVDLDLPALLAYLLTARTTGSRDRDVFAFTTYDVARILGDLTQEQLVERKAALGALVRDLQAGLVDA